MLATYLAGAARRFGREQHAATATEYAVMLALILVVILVSVSALGTSLSGSFTTSEAAMFS